MNSAAAPVRRRRRNPLLVVIRVLIVTVAFGVLGLSVGGLMGIIAVAIINATGVHTDMYMAIVAGAAPGALIAAAIGLVIIIRSEARTARGVRS